MLSAVPRPAYLGAPVEDGPTPRRRRTVWCGSLRVDGRATSPEEIAAIRSRLPKLFTAKGEVAGLPAFRCGASGRHLLPIYVADLCLTSWCRVCPERQDGGTFFVPLSTPVRRNP